MGFLAPRELSWQVVATGEQRSALSTGQMFVLGILAGVYIGFGAHLATVVGSGDWANEGMRKLASGGVFSVGLMLVIIAGAELFTGNNLMTMAWLGRRISLGQMLRNWVVVYIGNFVGALLLAFFIAHSSGLLAGDVGANAIRIAYGKVADIPVEHLSHTYAFFFRAICCNWLVCLAVMLAVSADSVAGKIPAIFFPIMAFVAMGFEHSIANMYFIPAGMFALRFEGATLLSGLTDTALRELTWSNMWTGNLLIVSLGNLVGGGLFVGVAYWYVYIHKGRLDQV